MLFDYLVYCNITLMYQEQLPANHDKTEAPIPLVTTSALNKEDDSQTTSDSFDPADNADSSTHMDLQTFSEHDNHVVKADDSVTDINNKQLTDFSENNEDSGSDMDVDPPDNNENKQQVFVQFNNYRNLQYYN